MMKMEVKLRCVAFRSDDLGKDFTQGRIYEADDVAMETDTGRNLWCDGTFESLVKSTPDVEYFLYPLRDGEDAEYVVNTEFGTYPLFKVKLITAHGIVLFSDDGLCLFKRIHDIKKKM